MTSRKDVFVVREIGMENSWQNFSRAADVSGMASELHMQLQRYIEAQYPIRHPEVIAERHALLETVGVISQEPFIESMPGYQPGAPYHKLALPALVTQALQEMASCLHPSFLRVSISIRLKRWKLFWARIGTWLW